MSQLGQALLVRQDRARVISTPNNCWSHSTATNFVAVLAGMGIFISLHAVGLV
jgi:hypothetical protein